MSVLDEVKTRLGISGDFHDELLTSYISDVKVYLASAGVPSAVIESADAYGCIARGVADLWNYGAGDGKFSEVFRERAVQMAYEVSI